MKTLNRFAATSLLGIVFVAVLLPLSPAYAQPLYPVTLEVRYGEASRVFERTDAGANVLSSEFAQNSEYVKTSVSGGNAASVVRDNFEMQYTLRPTDNSDALMLQTSMHIRTHRGHKSLTTRVALVPGQWLVLSGSRSVTTTANGKKTAEQFLVLIRVSGS